jgi:OHCU decarboxylase
MKGIERINQLPEADARSALLDCCGAREWVARVLAHKPFASGDQLLETADRVWAELQPEVWLEAFRHHPAIGSSKAKQKQSATARKWSTGEQSVAQKASAETLSLLAAANREYHDKFGHVFLICATGKTSEEILQSLQRRLPNDRDAELRIAAEEQRKITRLRLQKLLAL